MFQLNGIKLFLIVLIVASLGVFWYLETKYYRWDGIEPEPEEMVVEIVPEPIQNDTFKQKEFVPTNEWQNIDKGIQF